MINSVTELKIKKTKLSTILTSTNVNLPMPIEGQLAVIASWANSASRTILFSDQKPSHHNGLRLNKVASQDLPIVNILRSYVVQIPGAEVFAIAAPNVIIKENQEAFFGHVEKQKMERAWAAFFTTGSDPTPKVFIMSAPVLPHILRDFPPNLTFGTNAWAIWLHSWLKKFMLQHRYFDGNQFGIVEGFPEPEAVAPISTPEPAVIATPATGLAGEQKAPQPKKRGRPAKKQETNV